ncbi:MAG: DNA-binding protein [Steroidobacteraceae bacterium]
MKTVVLEVRSLEDSIQDFGRAWQGGKPDSSARICFASAELLWQVLTGKRWTILKTMTSAGALSVREIARRVERDVKAVHADVQALLRAGILERSERRVVFPYDAVHVDFVLRAAA